VRSALVDRGMEVVGIATDADDATVMAADLQPEVVLLDLGLPDRGGLALGRELMDAHPQLIVIALTALESPQAVNEALRLGFRGYVTKSTPVDRFVRSVEAATQGQTVVPSHLVRAANRASEGPDLLAEQLTPREREVLRLLVEGVTGADIARRLKISANTVRTHVQSILTKLQVHSRLEAATFAVRHRIVEVPRPDAVMRST
jgi:DNA-binding NarL/FixJ family response regulator